MLDLLKEYMDKAATPEETQEMERACQALDKMGVDDYEYPIEEMLNTDDEVDAGTTLFQITQYVRTHLFQVLTQHSIMLDADVTTTQLVEVVEGVLALGNYDNHAELVAIINQSKTNTEETFCKVMALVTKYSTEELMTFVVSVSDAILTSIKESEDVIEREDEEIAIDRREKLKQFRLYLDYINLLGGAPHIESLVRGGMDAGYPLFNYIQQMEYIFNRLDGDHIANELFGAVVLCGNVTENRPEMIKNSLESFTTDPDLVTAIISKVNAINSDWKP